MDETHAVNIRQVPPRPLSFVEKQFILCNKILCDVFGLYNIGDFKAIVRFFQTNCCTWCNRPLSEVGRNCSEHFHFSCK